METYKQVKVAKCQHRLEARLGSDLEAQTVIDMLTPDFRNLAVAELLGDAAPSASSPRALTHEELVAGLARFELGEVDAVHAEARNRIEARAAAPDAMQS